MIRLSLASAVSLLHLGKTTSAVGCSTHSFTSCDDNIVHWFDPDTGQICDPLDCGGARAPFRSDVPGCPRYTGTETPSTSYLSCWSLPGFGPTTLTTSAGDEPQETETIEISTAVSAVVRTSTISSTYGGTKASTASTSTPPGTLATADETVSGSASDASDTAGGPEPTNASGFIHVPLIAIASVVIGLVMLT